MSDFSIQHLFANLEDPRQAHKVKHRLDDIILLAIFAVISNAQSWTEIEAFGQAKEEWLFMKKRVRENRGSTCDCADQILIVGLQIVEHDHQKRGRCIVA